MFARSSISGVTILDLAFAELLVSDSQFFNFRSNLSELCCKARINSTASRLEGLTLRLLFYIIVVTWDYPFYCNNGSITSGVL